MRTVICAANAHEAMHYAREHNLATRDVIYASSASRLHGLRDVQVVNLPSFYHRRDWQQIESALELAQLKLGLPEVGTTPTP
ncbi:MAG: hypothetical protein QJR03_13945 [Sphaerobacter sp.]|nr:hypothetical protein [Sphaerobacter sp.]